MTQFFPFRTTIMLTSLCSILITSCVTSVIFNKGLLSERWDVFQIKRSQAKVTALTKLKKEESKKDYVEAKEAVVNKQLLDTSC